MKKIIVGQHVMAELLDCDPALLNQRDYLVRQLSDAAREAGATVLDVSSHQFEPHGVTVIALLSESHISIHTWPEYNYAAVDMFTCGENMMPEKAIEVLKVALDSKDLRMKSINRGMPSDGRR